MRKLNALSQGIRGLQAKLHLLRDESDKLAEVTNHSSLKSAIHYESIGADLKLLLEEWEEGRASFASETEKARHRLSLHTLDGAVPSSPTLSLGGITAVGGSPTEDSAAFCEYPKSHQSCPSTTTNSSGEEVFEAVALPRQRSTLTREERIAKMKEERVRATLARGTAANNTHMLKELESVIKLRPRGRTTGRLTSV